MKLLLLTIFCSYSLAANVYPIIRGWNVTFVNPDDCSTYCKCSGFMANYGCGFFEKFDPVKRQCVSTILNRVNCSGVAQETNQCYTGKESLFMDPKDCSRYYKCNGNTTVEKCGILKKYDPATLECKVSLPFDKVDCYAAPGSGLTTVPTPETTTATPKTTTPTPETTTTRTPNPVPPTGFSCNGRGNGFYVDQTDCERYYICTNGSAAIQKCGFLEKFDPIKLKCRISTIFNPVNCPPPVCKREGFNPVPGDCLAFYNCTKGVPKYVKCGVMEKFDPITLKCRISTIFDPVNCDPSSGNITTTPIPFSCKSNGLFPDPSDCGFYYNCSNGIPYRKKCGFLEKFDPEKLKCRVSTIFDEVNCPYVPPTPVPFVCKKNGTYPVPNDCSGYYTCSKGEKKFVKCGFLKKFDPSTLQCRRVLPFENFNCTERQKSVFTCEDKIDGNYPDKSCSGYYICTKGEKNYVKCGFLKKYDPKTQSCRFTFPFFYSCHSVPPTPKPVHPNYQSTTKVTGSSIGSTTTNKPTGDDFSCEDKLNGDYPDAKNCAKYFTCKDGIATEMECGKNELFDVDSNRCRFDDNPYISIKCFTADTIHEPIILEENKASNF